MADRSLWLVGNSTKEGIFSGRDSHSVLELTETGDTLAILDVVQSSDSGLELYAIPDNLHELSKGLAVSMVQQDSRAWRHVVSIRIHNHSECLALNMHIRGAC